MNSVVDQLRVFVLARLDEARAPDGDVRRELVEWALGVEALRQMGDPDAPVRAVGVEVLEILATEWAERPGYQPEWRRE